MRLYSKTKLKTFFPATPEVKNEIRQLLRSMCMHIYMQILLNSLFLLKNNRGKAKAFIPICYSKIYKYQTTNAA